jgi:phospho-N-acetylmuramoyl-pentapeptide-transferase
MQTWVLSIIGLIVTFSLTVVCGLIILPILKKKKMNQPILEYLPPEQQLKSHTPTMGGVFFIIPITICLLLSLIFLDSSLLKNVLAVAITSFLFGMVGVRDDYKKLKFKKNEGLKAWQKLLLQAVIAIAFVIVTTEETSVYIPFFKTQLELGWAYYPLAVIGICGIVNAVNLTDGVDGLASSVTAVVCVFFAALSFRDENDATMLASMITLGGCLGFLVFNAYPAKVFMGDTGSLFLGGMCFMLGKYSGMSLILIVVGFIFIFEVISVMLQVSYFKLTHGKRIFKMAPFHHHLQQCGFTERKIVVIFSLVTLLLGVLSFIFA